MAAATVITRGARPILRPTTANNLRICADCRRSFVTNQVLNSGHNKWSKIRHEKAANDLKKNMMRTAFGKDIASLSRLFGPDPNQNFQLAAMIEKAKKASVPKSVIDAAIARGQGRSLTGGVLEPMTFEIMVPPSTAIIVDIETESKTRILQDLNQMVKKAKGTAGSSKFFFTRVGRVVFQKSETGVDVDDIMDDAIEAGAEDLENDADGNIVVWTEPSKTTHVAKSIGDKFNLKISSCGITWSPNEDTKAKLDSSEDLVLLAELLDDLREYPDVRSIYSNVTRGNMSDQEWESIEQHLDV
ncbi:Transcriptional regulator domain containing protein [Naviculisporaceae sp. PSN 640]